MYYVYKLIDPRNNLPFYVGKGKDNRARSHLKGNSKTCNPRKDKRIQEIYEIGLEPIIDIFITGLDEKSAYNIEEEIILNLGREGIDENGILTNISLYSQPPSQKGKKRFFTEEHKQRLSISLKGKPKQYKTWNKGLSKETDDRLKQMAINRSKKGNNHQKGQKYSQDRIEKIKNTLKGRIVPEDQRLKMSKAKKGKTWEEIFGNDESKRRRENIITGENHHNAKKISTPAGIFNTITEAVKYFKISDYTIRKRCKSEKDRWNGWFYI